MQMIKILLSPLLLIGITLSCLATPPFQVLRTCIDIEPFEKSGSISRMTEEGYADSFMDGCEDQFDRTFDDHVYGTLSCNDKFFLIIRDKKIDPALAFNNSINPEIKPGVPFTIRALWYKIDFENKQFLCIRAPLAEHGVGSSHNQYYIVENAFNAHPDPKVYFYFEDQNIAPITSKTL